MNTTDSRGHDGTDQVVPTDVQVASQFLDPQYLIPEDTISHPFRLVSSTAVSYIGYDEPTGTLYVCLIAEGNEPFKYGGVPLAEYHQFMESASKGVYYNKSIKPYYTLLG